MSTAGIRGGDPDALDRLANRANHGSAAVLAIRGIAESVVRDNPLLGELGRRLATEFESDLLPRLRQVEDALADAAEVLAWNAQEQRHASDATAAAPAGPRPTYRTPPLETASASTWARAAGGLQLVGGAVETAVGGVVGVGAWLAPEPFVTKVFGTALAGVLVAHGSDTVAAGYRTLRDGVVHDTYTHQLAENAARAAGVPERGAWWIGFGTDLLAGAAPGAGVSLIRGAGTQVVGEADALLLATRQRGTDSSAWHSMVGVRLDGVERWGDLVRDGRTGMLQWVDRPPATGTVLRRPISGMWIREIPVEAGQAGAAREAMDALNTRFGRGGLEPMVPWSRSGPNCATAACDVLTAGGLDLPSWANKHPATLNLSTHPLVPPAAPSAAAAGQAAASGGSLLGNGSLDRER